MTTISFAKAIKTILSTKTIKDVIQNKVYPLVAPLNTTFPYIVFQRNANVNTTKDNKYMDYVTIEIIAVSDNYDKSIEIAEIVRSEIEGIRNKEIEGFNIQTVSLSGINESYSNDAYLQSLTFNFKINIQ